MDVLDCISKDVLPTLAWQYTLRSILGFISKVHSNPFFSVFNNNWLDFSKSHHLARFYGHRLLWKFEWIRSNTNSRFSSNIIEAKSYFPDAGPWAWPLAPLHVPWDPAPTSGFPLDDERIFWASTARAASLPVGPCHSPRLNGGKPTCEKTWF